MRPFFSPSAPVIEYLFDANIHTSADTDWKDVQMLLTAGGHLKVVDSKLSLLAKVVVSFYFRNSEVYISAYLRQFWPKCEK